MPQLLSTDWDIIYRDCTAFLEGEAVPNIPHLELMEAGPSVSFPVYDGGRNDGKLVFLSDNPVSFLTENANGSGLNPDSPDKIPLYNKSDVGGIVVPSVQKLINDRYPCSGDFVDFEGNIKYTFGIRIDPGVKQIDGSSFNLALAAYLMLKNIEPHFNKRISLTGCLDGNFSVTRIDNLEEKLKAVLAYGLDIFFIPEGNRADIAGCLSSLIGKGKAKENVNSFVIGNGATQLEVVPVSNLEEVLNYLFPPEWHKKEYFLEKFDLSHGYKKLIRESTLVKIKSMIEVGYLDMKYFIEAKLVRKTNAGEEIEATPSDLLNGLKNGSGRIVVFGVPGSGKSTLIRNYLYTLCCEESLIPVFVQLGQFEVKGDFVASLIDFIDMQGGLGSFNGAYKAYLKKLYKCNKDRFVFLLDAYDEMTKQANISDDIETLQKAVITSRHCTIPDITDSYELKLLSSEDISTFARHRIPEGDTPDEKNMRVEKLNRITQLAAGPLQEVVSNPLMLSLAISLVKQNPDADIISRTHILSEGTNLLINGRVKPYNRTAILKAAGYKRDLLEIINDFLSKTAYDTFNNNVISDDKIRVYLEKAGISAPDDTIVEAATTGCGILREVGTATDNYRKTTFFGFSHKLFSEFYTSRCVVELSDTEFDRFIDEKRFDLRYSNIFVFIAGLLDMQVGVPTPLPGRKPEEKLEQIFKVLLAPVDIYNYSDLILSALCLKEIKYQPSSEDRVIEAFIEERITTHDALEVFHIPQSSHKITLLGDLGMKKAIPRLKEILTSGSDTRKVAAAIAIGKLCGENAIPDIAPLLKSDNWFLCQDALRVLAGFGITRAIPHIVSTLHDEIKKEAYYRFEKRGGVHDDKMKEEDWLEAMRFVLWGKGVLPLIEDVIRKTAYYIGERGFGDERANWFDAQRDVIAKYTTQIN